MACAGPAAEINHASGHWHCVRSGYSASTVADPNVETPSQPADQARPSASVPPAAAPTALADAADVSPEDELRAEVARLKDNLLRTMADFDNFRKRSRRELADAERMAREDLLREMLPVFDNLDRAGQHAGSAKDIQSIVDGIQMVMRQFLDTLGRLGIERIEAVGQPFDPAVHEAIQQMETTEVPAGCVAAEVLTGYRQGERLVRPAMVVVARAPSGD